MAGVSDGTFTHKFLLEHLHTTLQSLFLFIDVFERLRLIGLENSKLEPIGFLACF